MASHVERGAWAERMAAAYLGLRGYRILARNFRASRLEIDLIARMGNVLAVVEVKYRESGRRGGARAAVGPRKQRDLETAALGYLRAEGLGGVRVRFDVIVVEPLRPGASDLVVSHIPNAFGATGRYLA